MADELSRFRERLRQNRTQRAAQARGLVEEPAGVSVLRRGTTVAGARVFDTISGEEGEVIGGSRENISIPAPDATHR